MLGYFDRLRIYRKISRCIMVSVLKFRAKQDCYRGNWSALEKLSCKVNILSKRGLLSSKEIGKVKGKHHFFHKWLLGAGIILMFTLFSKLQHCLLFILRIILAYVIQPVI